MSAAQPSHADADSVADAIQTIINNEFMSLRVTPQRSDPYIEGFRNALEKRATGRDRPNTYQPGTAAADTYLSDKAEGRDFVLRDDWLTEQAA